MHRPNVLGPRPLCIIYQEHISSVCYFLLRLLYSQRNISSALYLISLRNNNGMTRSRVFPLFSVPDMPDVCLYKTSIDCCQACQAL